MSKSARFINPYRFFVLAILNVFFIFAMLSEPLGDAAESLMIKMAAPFQSKYLYDNPKSSLAYDFQVTDTSKFWSKDNILLLTIDDLEVQSTGTPYPFSYARYADDIRLAYQLQAKAIFIDLLITDERGENSGIEYLLNTICEINETTPIFIASTRLSGQNFDPTPLHPVLAKHSNFQTQNPVCFQEVSVSLSNKPGEHKYWYYPLYQSKKNTQGEQSFLPSAGVAIYNQFAKDKGLATIDVQKIDNSESLMALTWGADPAKFNINFENDRRRRDQKSMCREKKDVLEYLSFLPGLSIQFKEKDIPICPYFPETRPGFLAGLESSDEKGKKAAQELVENSLVIYSVNLTGVSDIVNSPVHGTISGAHYHAMALHNLDRFGNNYIKNTEIQFSSLYTIFNWSTPEHKATVILVVLIILLTASSLYLRFCLKYKTPKVFVWLKARFSSASSHKGLVSTTIFFSSFLAFHALLFVLKTIVYIALACAVVIILSQFILLDPFIWIEAATLVTLLFASNPIGNLFEKFFQRTPQEQEPQK